MAEGSRGRSWWHTLPGILTGLAGLVTATAGLLLALDQLGVFDKSPNGGHVVGPTLIAVPRVIDLTPDAARRALEQAGLRLGQTEHIRAVPRLVGHVTGQDPKPGTQVKAGTAVKLYVGRP